MSTSSLVTQIAALQDYKRYEDLHWSGSFEEYLATSTKPAPACPKCGAPDPTRVWSTISTEWLPSDVAWDRVNRSWD